MEQITQQLNLGKNIKKKKKRKENPLLMPYNINRKSNFNTIDSGNTGAVNSKRTWTNLRKRNMSVNSQSLSNLTLWAVSKAGSSAAENQICPRYKKSYKSKFQLQEQNTMRASINRTNAIQNSFPNKKIIPKVESVHARLGGMNINSKKRNQNFVDDILHLKKSKNAGIPVQKRLGINNPNLRKEQVTPYSYASISKKHHSIINRHFLEFNVSSLDNSVSDESTDNHDDVESIELKQAVDNSQKEIKYMINNNIEDNEACKKMNASWMLNSPLVTDDCEVIVSPFKCIVFKRFFSNGGIIKKLYPELRKLPLHQKNNDMYKFSQSDDLQVVDSPYISSLHKTMLEVFRPLLEKMTGIKLLDKMSMTLSQYGFSDVLLCHNDQLEGRRIAYVLYLTPSWDKDFGGSLDLFAVDENHKPSSIERQLLPQRNSLVLFEVTKDSFHQVSEVLTKKKKRLSINGWFYSKETDSTHSYPPSPWYFFPPTSVEEDVIYAWINPLYLNEETHKDIKTGFENNSEVALENFLISTKFEELCKELKNCSWNKIGPQNLRHYEVMNHSTNVINEFLQLLKSDAMFLILSQLTGLKLHHLYNCSDLNEDETYAELDSKVFTQVRKWTTGCYTMLRDDDVTARKNFALDVTLFCNVPHDWTADYGGYVSYIAENENEELLTVMPEENKLSLVYRDQETMKFTKYINEESKQAFKEGEQHFYEIYSEYREDQSLLS